MGCQFKFREGADGLIVCRRVWGPGYLPYIALLAIEQLTFVFSFALGNSEFMTWLLSNGADPNLGPRDINHGINRRDEPPVRGSGFLLNQAAGICNVEQFDLLLASGAVLEDSCALHYASHFSPDPDDTRLMAHLLDLGVDINAPDDKVDLQKPGRIGAPIFWAIRSGRCIKVRFLVESGADLTIRCPWDNTLPIEEARKTGCQEIIGYLDSVSSSHSS